VDDTVTPLTFTLHNGDIVALLDDGSLRRWKRPSQSESQWREVSSISSTTGMETFRVRFRTGISTQTNYASTQLSYNDAIAVSKTHLYFGAGRLLKQVVITYVLYTLTNMTGCGARVCFVAFPFQGPEYGRPEINYYSTSVGSIESSIWLFPF